MPIPTEDPTVNMTLDEKIQPNTAAPVTSFDISQPVVPGHDMVINHPNGSQELGTANEALAVAAAEKATGQHTPLSAVQPAGQETLHRSVFDPEVNGPAQDALKAEAAAAALPEEAEEEAVSAPAEAPVEEPAVPAEPEAEPEAPVEEAAVREEAEGPTAADVEGV